MDAVGGLQRGDKSLATVYLQFVEQHRGRAAAEAAVPTLKAYASSEAFADCYIWPAWDYQTKPPPKPPAPPAPKKGRRR